MQQKVWKTKTGIEKKRGRKTDKESQTHKKKDRYNKGEKKLQGETKETHKRQIDSKRLKTDRDKGRKETQTDIGKKHRQRQKRDRDKTLFDDLSIASSSESYQSNLTFLCHFLVGEKGSTVSLYTL